MPNIINCKRDVVTHSEHTDAPKQAAAASACQRFPLCRARAYKRISAQITRTTFAGTMDQPNPIWTGSTTGTAAQMEAALRLARRKPASFSASRERGPAVAYAPKLHSFHAATWNAMAMVFSERYGIGKRTTLVGSSPAILHFYSRPKT